MFKIGDFSRLTQVPVTALRYYDETGLLKPGRVDRFTGYRYYSVEQLPRLNRILALKDLGFSLEEIARLLAEDVPATQMRGMLRLKQSELQQRVQTEQARLARIEARLRQIEQEDTMSAYEVVLKKVEPQLVAGVEATIPTQDEVNLTFNRLFDEVFAYVDQQGGRYAGVATALWHDAEYQERDLHVGAAVPIQEPIPANERVQVHELPGTDTMACVVHHGPFATLGEAYSAVTGWIESNGYRVAGPNRELYLQYERNGDQAQYVTEIQFPVTKD
jgi:DNA-binding transcriptional MerR regulator